MVKNQVTKIIWQDNTTVKFNLNYVRRKRNRKKEQEKGTVTKINYS